MEFNSKLSKHDGVVEEEILRRALQGSPEAFEQVITIYSRRLYAVAYAVVQNPAEAEDVVQDTLLKAYARRWLIRDPNKLPAWLCNTARNRACDIVRKRAYAAIHHEDLEMEAIADGGVPCPSANLDSIERSGAVHRLLGALPENHRVAVTLRFMEGMEYREIEETMGVSNGALRGILARAMKTLRKDVDAALLPNATVAL